MFVIGQVKDEVAHYMMIFDKDANDYLDGREFQKMMCTQPWSKVTYYKSDEVDISLAYGNITFLTE